MKRIVSNCFKHTTLVCISIIMMLSFASCKEEPVDMTGLLSTVPASTSGVVCIDLQSILKDLGCKINGKKIEAGKELSKIISSMEENEKSFVLKMFDGYSGISPECTVIFYDSNRCFLTVSLADVEGFCSFIENETGSTFSDAGNGVRLCANVAVKGAQAWLCISSNKRIDADAIVAYSSLKRSQSFLNTGMASRFTDTDDAITGWGSINTILSGIMDRGNLSMLNIGLNLFFEESSDLCFSVNFEKGKLEAEAILLNESGKPAKYLLPSEKINISTIENLGESCDALFAMTVTPKLVDKIEKIVSTFSPSFSGLLKNVDGTVSVIFSNPLSGGFGNIKGVIPTKGEVSQELKNFVTTGIAPVTDDGKYLTFSKGEVSGKLSVKECASFIKGSCLGFVADLESLTILDDGIPSTVAQFSNIAFTMSPESGGIEFEIILTGSNQNENILLTCLKAL